MFIIHIPLQLLSPLIYLNTPHSPCLILILFVFCHLSCLRHSNHSLSNSKQLRSQSALFHSASADRGPMVPQKRYKPHTSSDRRRYVDEVHLESSINFFMHKPDEEGIPLKDAMHGRFARLVARDESMFQERGPSISVRINVSVAPHSFAVYTPLSVSVLTWHYSSGLAINPGAVRFLPGISVTPLALSHVRNSQRMWPSPSLASSWYALSRVAVNRRLNGFP
jgi:hypothetical protein